MPMPPPKASTEGPRDRHVFHEMGQIVRALEAIGPLDVDQLRQAVGGSFWEQGRFDYALALTLADGMAYRTDDGRVSAS